MGWRIGCVLPALSRAGAGSARTGRQRAPDGNYTTQAYVDDMAAFSDALVQPPFILMGHSMGFRTCIAFVVQHPDKVRNLVLVEAGPIIDPRGAERIKQEIRDVPESLESFESVVAYMGKQNRFASDAVVRRRLRYAAREQADGAVGWRYDVAIRDQTRNGTGAPPEDMWALPLASPARPLSCAPQRATC